MDKLEENVNRLEGVTMDHMESMTDSNKISNLEKNLSKRQIKRAKKAEKWLERKNEKRRQERAKTREKRAFARANNIDLGPSRKALKRSTMAESSCKLTITIDLSFDDLMIDKDIAKLIKQILRCYTLNRRAMAPLQFSLTSFNGKSKKEMEKHNGYEHWDVKFEPDSYMNVYSKDKIVYLTSESPNMIDKLDHSCIYVIGGLVDHNRHKGLCHKLAVDNGIKHGRLPLDKFLLMKARKVLTIDHVFEILLRITEGKTWQEAFLQVLPERKKVQPIVSLEKKVDEQQKTNDDNIGKDIDTNICNIENVFKQD